MRATVAYIKEIFDKYNVLYFGSELPAIPIRLSNAKTFLGKVCFKKQRVPLTGKYKYSDFVLRINVAIDLPEDVVVDTILHEMIHYYIAIKQWEDRSAHGPLFRKEMARINGYGHMITISHKMSEEEKKQVVMTEKWRVVCVAQMADGKIGIKVLPKQERHIVAFDSEARRRFKIEKMDWYMTKNAFFGPFPSSAAMRLYIINDKEALAQALNGAMTIRCDGKRAEIVR